MTEIVYVCLVHFQGPHSLQLPNVGGGTTRFDRRIRNLPAVAWGRASPFLPTGISVIASPLGAPHISPMKTDARREQLTAALPAMGRDPASVRQRVEALEQLLERAFTVPILGRVGLDSVVGLLPVVGDVVTAAMGSYLIWEARNLGVSRWTQARMVGNLGVDTALGMIPFAGDIFDFVFKSNSKNLRLIKRHLDRHHPGQRTIDARPL